MNQTAINVIAIAVFMMTFSSLLGPVLHLSPVIPAIATLIILGLATFDSWSLQGNGVNLLLSLIASSSREDRDRLVRHEAGHFLVAYLLKIPISGYTLSAWEAFRQGHSGQAGVSFEDQELRSQVERGVLSVQLLDRYCIVWMAGIAAEQLLYGNVEGGINDRDQLRILWTQHLKRPLSECSTKERWAILQAKTIIQDHQEAYEALVAAMQQRASVAECQQMIEPYRQQPAVS